MKQAEVVNFSVSSDTCLMVMALIERFLGEMEIGDLDREFTGEFLAYLEQAYKFQATTMEAQIGL